jgi:serine/threonine-protein kinase
VVGSAFYLPPEQVGRAREVDHRADLYSLGATLFFLLTGRPPFPRRRSFRDVCRDVLTESPRRPSRYGKGIPAELDPILARAMAKSPDDRYPEIGAFCDALSKRLPDA